MISLKLLYLLITQPWKLTRSDGPGSNSKLPQPLHGTNQTIQILLAT